MRRWFVCPFDTTASIRIHTGCGRLLEEAFGETPSPPCLPPPTSSKLILAAAFKESYGAPSSGPTISWSRDSGNSGPTSLMKNPEAISTSSTRGSISFRPWKEAASIGAMEKGSSRRSPRGLPAFVHLSLFYLTGNLSSAIKKREAFHPARWMAKAISFSISACSGPTCNDNAGSKDLRDRSLRRSSSTRAAWEWSGHCDRSCVQRPQTS
ncbi:hypothetical protein GWK47_032974 [Chionoecetes opilio]|uniref:Uncharacterized protein n=1 Tax=Chionoecetes opilio TaxID=41210 RepID=A0A8J5D468_CHIOP|nr:hypothetical protein GWK47_032974 [Chionoecetes opilio]